jgi:hypothetical protein
MPLPTPIPPLSRADLTYLQQSLTRQRRRRRAYRPGPLRVYADGHERWQGDPRAGACAPFHVPLTVAVLEVFGEDAAGLLLLAVVPLPSPEDVAPDGAEHLAVPLEGGQTVALTIERGRTPRSRRPAYVIQLTYTDPPAAETPGPAVVRMPAHILALRAEVERMQTQAVQFFAGVERLQTQALALLAKVERLQGQTLALHRGRVHLRALRAQVKDALQRLQQLSAETPWVRRDEGDHGEPDPEAPPPEGPSG